MRGLIDILNEYLGHGESVEAETEKGWPARRWRPAAETNAAGRRQDCGGYVPDTSKAAWATISPAGALSPKHAARTYWSGTPR
uniref:Uncharacterized protein n=1 Tax=Desulfovibrio sp. U5L TaxID=596152 RepID=I2Q766_9BACT